MCTSPTDAAAEASASATMMPTPTKTDPTSLCSMASKKKRFQRLTPSAATRFATTKARTPPTSSQARRFVAPLQNPRASLENFRATRPGGGFGGSSPAARSPSAVSDAMFIKTAQLAPVSSMPPEERRSAPGCVASTWRRADVPGGLAPARRPSQAEDRA